MILELKMNQTKNAKTSGFSLARAKEFVANKLAQPALA